jgi:hypothetical protein
VSVAHDRIADIQRLLADGALTPDMARESQLTLSALLGNLNQEYRQADAAYKRVYLTALRTEEKANRARIVSEDTPEYRAVCDAKDLKDAVVEMIRSCRAYLRSLDEEMRLAR